MKKYIIIKHSILRNISDEEVLELFSGEDEVLKTFEIQPESTTQHKIGEIAFENAALLQKEYVDKEVLPFIKKHPEAIIVYFGAAPVPLAVHLGYLLGNWHNHEIRLLNHTNQNWHWANENKDGRLPIFKKYVLDDIEGGGNIVFRVESSFEMQANDTNEGLNSIVKQVELKLDKIDKEAFQSVVQSRLFVEDFEEGIDSIINKFPGAETIHLFAAVPVGIAYLMGTKIRPNLNKRIALYQYDANRNPKYDRVLMLSQAQIVQEPIKGKIKKEIQEVRAKFGEEVNGKIVAFANEKSESNSKAENNLSWFASSLPKDSYSEYEVDYWSSLPSLFNTIIKDTVVDVETNNVPGGFTILDGPPAKWQIDDRFIQWLYKRFNKNQTKVQCALRLFLFHEAVHYHHHLTAYTANEAGGFPRILEEVDYQADVWAMIHEFSFSKMYYSVEVKDIKVFFKNLIETATETMWAFDDAGSAIRDEIQIRRMNRYLIWYWQLLRIEDSNCKSLKDIVIILSHKPLVEMNGLLIKTNGRRVLFDLLNYKAASLEIGALQNNKIHRRGNTPNIDLSKIVEGFKERSGPAILTALKAFYKEITI